MFTATADLYDLVYTWKDYVGEAARLCELIGHEGGTLLDIACGTGKHLEQLGTHYRCEGLDIDPRMVEIARSRGFTVHEGDMTTFDLGRRFDVVTCLFSSIAYAPSLDKAVANLARHVAPGGVLAVEPWLSPEVIVPGRVGMHTADTEAVKVARMNSITVEGRASILDFHYLVGRQGGVEHLTERHVLWLWNRDEYAAAFTHAGLEATCDEEGLMGRGLWIAVRTG